METVMASRENTIFAHLPSWLSRITSVLSFSAEKAQLTFSCRCSSKRLQANARLVGEDATSDIPETGHVCRFGCPRGVLSFSS
jgi:redox-regulated HSP33 family molecular chaperone